jgi:uncharacterized membrane-anchored protein
MQTNALTRRTLLSKVPEVMIFFWIIKILCTTVGETAADYLNETLNLGLAGTSLACGALLVVVLYFQFRARKYIPALYWLAVVLISIAGTLITDNLTDGLGVPLVTTTLVFAGLLAATFAGWYAVERTLSVHTIYTTRREGFYWLTILFTFALGTAAGDLVAEHFALGYLPSLALFAGLIAVVAIAHFVRKRSAAGHGRRSVDATLAFWIAYILTRPLGASLGDFLSQAREDGGLNMGPTMTSIVFLAAILALVVYLSLTRKDEIHPDAEPEETVGIPILQPLASRLEPRDS